MAINFFLEKVARFDNESLRAFNELLLTYIFSQNKLTDISIILLFAILGFFVFNFPPAKLYLGDSGSLFIGFLLGFISILFTWNNADNQILSYVISPIVLFFTILAMVFFLHRNAKF